MNFVPAPITSFQEFIDTYFDRCRERVPEIEANAGKWRFEDLIPGLSDFDTRFVVRDGMTTSDWCRMSTEVGRVHCELARERRDWARTLEHLPGVNMTWTEMTDPAQYFSEFGKWTFYCGPAEPLQRVGEAIAAHAWCVADEAYHWKTFAIYYGPYNRSIDPAINLGPYENKYPLHSRLMHYFAPAVHSAVCLAMRLTTAGKLDALRTARRLFPAAETIDRVFELVGRHYEAPTFLVEPGLNELDRLLDDYLGGVVEALLARGDGPLPPGRPTVPELRAAMTAFKPSDPLVGMFEHVKFARLMKGRLWFYSQDILWFETAWLIRNELRRMRTNFFVLPLESFAKHILERPAPAEEALMLIEGSILDHSQADACRRFSRLLLEQPPDGELKRAARTIADHFDPFLDAIETLVAAARQITSTR